MRDTAKLKHIIRVDGYTIGRCRNEIFVINPDGLMTWLDTIDKVTPSTMGLPGQVPSSVLQYVIELLKSNGASVQPIQNPRLTNILTNRSQKLGKSMNKLTAWLFPGQGSQIIGMGASLQSVNRKSTRVAKGIEHYLARTVLSK